MSASFLHKINKTYFWDVDYNTLDETRSKRLIIERTATLGNLQEINLLLKHYGKKEVLKILSNLNYIDSKTLAFFSLVFHVPRNKFKCYSRKQSIKQHGNF